MSKFRRKTEGEKIDLRDLLQKPALTKRDKEVLLSLYYHRCLTTHQLVEMHFRFNAKDGSENKQAYKIAQNRLRKMFDWQLIDRFFVQMPEGGGSSPQYVVLDKLGAKVVAGMLGISMEDLEWKYEMNENRLPYLEHMVSINNFYISFLKCARTYNHQIPTFLVEHHVRHEFMYDKRKYRFNPDAYGQYFIAENEGFHFLLEWDNGTMTLQVFKKKLLRYHAFYASKEYQKFYGDTFPLVLVVAPNERRALSLRNTIYSEGTPLRWYFTTKALVEANPLGAIWLGEAKNPVSLLD